MSSATTKDYISTLNGLIETCKDGEEGFRSAAAGVQRTDLKSLFDDYSRQRAEFASELQVEVARIGGAPETSGSVSGALHRGWINIKSAVSGKDDHAILEEAERGEDSAVKNYREALATDMPADFRALVQKQSEKILQTHDRVRSLRDNAEERYTAGSSAASR